MNTDGIVRDKSEAAAGAADMSDATRQSRGPLFFSFPELNQCLDLLFHLTDSSDLVLLVNGERGAGKTSLLYQFQSIAHESWQLCRIDANPMMHPEQLLAQLARAYDVREDVEPLPDRLIDRFQDMGREGVRPVLAIDDAHLLPVATLVQLMRLHELAKDEDSLLRVVLFAAPEIQAQLETPELLALDGQRLRQLTLPTLNEEQTGAFVAFYLNGRGLGQVVSFSPDQIQRLHRESRGIPGRVEVWVDKQIQPKGAVALPVDNDREGWRFGAVPLKWLFGALAAVLLIVVLVFQDSINRIFMDESADSEPQVVPLALPQEPAEEAKPDSMSQEAATEVQEETEPVQPLLDEAEPDLAVSASRPGQLEEAAESSEVAGEPVPVKEPEPATAVSEAEEPPGVAEEAVPKQPAPQSQPEEQAPPSAEPVSEPVSQEQPEPPTPKAVSEIMREDWLRQQNPAHYTLQLVGVQEEAAILAFIKRHGLKGQLAYFKSQRQGRPWFSLLYGVFPDRKAAIKAKGQLPAPLAQSGVWPRTFASVQKEVGTQ